MEPFAGTQLGCFQSLCLRLLSERQSKELSRWEPCLAVHGEPSSSLPPKEQHDRLLVLYPSTLVIVSEEHNGLCFKVSSFWSAFPLALSYPSAAANSALPWLVAPLHLGSLVLLVLAKGFPPRCSLASWQVSRRRDVASYLPMRNTLPSYRSPGGKGAGCQGIWVSGRREAGAFLCGDAGREPGSLA